MRLRVSQVVRGRRLVEGSDIAREPDPSFYRHAEDVCRRDAIARPMDEAGVAADRRTCWPLRREDNLHQVRHADQSARHAGACGSPTRKVARDDPRASRFGSSGADETHDPTLELLGDRFSVQLDLATTEEFLCYGQ
jgi:hypothetical protein